MKEDKLYLETTTYGWSGNSHIMTYDWETWNRKKREYSKTRDLGGDIRRTYIECPLEIAGPLKDFDMTDKELATITDEVRLEMQNRSDQEYIDNNPSDFPIDGYEMGK